MLRAPAAIRGVQLEGPDIVWRFPAPSWRHARHAPAALCLMRSCQARFWCRYLFSALFK